ncbi:NAD(P)H-binding protein [Glaciecola sp. MH2013]|uniref:NAD-dependent epimerase/dehydratase family protein n=1 Tax=Glaciecola sp. MH2013 TaxID=2785524 RepID=UPI00189D4DF6|nr:NAD(P)H-binding protein [Glaciecola sp. MH2013]MBF7074988.1 NAD(P)H-binding protein [Glaciecola sp. MH2013]
MTRHKQVIMGLGWLGSPLATQLLDCGNSVSGSTRNTEKAQLLKKEGISTFFFDLYTSSTNELNDSYFSNASLILNIPPGRKHFDPQQFVNKMKELINYAIKCGVRHIIFISTTAVFGKVLGEVNNLTELSPKTESGNAHADIERYLRSHAKSKDLRLDVLRLAGLVDNERHPVHSLAKKNDISLGKNPVNLVHKNDVIKCIKALLSRKHITGFSAMNLCSLSHPSRQEYYTWCAKELGITQPSFTLDDRQVADGKWINAKDTLASLALDLDFPSPFDMLYPKKE